MRKRYALTAVALACTLGVAACGDDDNDQGGGKAQTLAITLGADNKLQGVKQLSGGVVTVRFTNRAKKPYDLQLVRVDGNHTVQEVLKVTSEEGSAIPNWIHGAGGVGTIQPGQTYSATQVLPAGRYYLVSSPDEGGRDVTASLRVSGGESGGSLPQTTARISAFEYNFRTSGLKAGTQQVEVDNTGRELHHVIAFRLKPGATLAQAKKFFTTEGQPSGPPPIEEQGVQGTAVLDGGVKQVAQFNLRQGRYVFVCFLPDRTGGPPHVARGMIAEVNVPS